MTSKNNITKLTTKENLQLMGIIKSIQKEDYESFVKTLVSIEKGITDTEELDYIYTHFLANDSINLISDDFDGLIEDFKEYKGSTKEERIDEDEEHFHDIVKLLKDNLDDSDVEILNEKEELYTSEGEIVIFNDVNLEEIAEYLKEADIEELELEFSMYGTFRFRLIEDMYFLVSNNTTY